MTGGTARNDLCSCGSQIKYKKCCLSKSNKFTNSNDVSKITVTSNSNTGAVAVRESAAARKNKLSKDAVIKVTRSLGIPIKSEQDIVKMRAACKLAAKVLTSLKDLIRPGVSTLELNDFAHAMTLAAGATSAPLGYVISPEIPPFPKSICTSINEVVCHGIPCKEDILEEGDIINCDITVKLDGFHGDTSRTFIVGTAKPNIEELVKNTEAAMMVGIKQIAPFVDINRIGNAIEEFVKPFGYGIVKELTGHGVGEKFHELPTVYHFTKDDYSLKLVPGMIFTVEPMLNLGTPDVLLLDDQWTIITKDGLSSAQFEHTVLVTETGFEILTL